MNSLVDNIVNQRLKGNISGSCNHAAYLVRPGKGQWCFKRATKLWRKPL